MNIVNRIFIILGLLLSISLSDVHAQCIDIDNDLICDDIDPCPGFTNSFPLTDSDSDGIPDECDNCLTTSNLSQTDIDNDGIGDACDSCIDPDNDGVCDPDDKCPGFDDGVDIDMDGIPDGCDTNVCIDPDNDGVCDADDKCPGFDDGVDIDMDGIPDGCDSNVCIDPDGDGVCDPVDKCPGFDDGVDIDMDGIPDGCDDCIDRDQNGVCDNFEECVLGFSVRSSCDDGNPCTINDVYDIACNCSGIFEDTDRDGICDYYDECAGDSDIVDNDRDGIPDGCDDDGGCSSCTADEAGKITICHFPLNPRNLRTIKGDCNELSKYFDSSGGFANGLDHCGPCDCVDKGKADSDGDGVCDDEDGCPNNAMKTENDECGCVWQDSDGDGVCDELDECPDYDDKIDENRNGIADACDPEYKDYCLVSPNSDYEWIEHTNINGSEFSSNLNEGYSLNMDYIAIGQYAKIKLKLVPAYVTEICGLAVHLYVDWDRDKEFDDSEMMYMDIISDVLNAQIDIPESVELGTYRLRLILSNGRVGSACEPTFYGEVEDYTIDIIASELCFNISEEFDYADGIGLEGLEGGIDWGSEWRYNSSLNGNAIIIDEFSGNNSKGGSLGLVQLSGDVTHLSRAVELDLYGVNTWVYEMDYLRLSGNGSMNISLGKVDFGIDEMGRMFLGDERGELIELGENYHFYLIFERQESGEQLLTLRYQSGHSEKIIRNIIADIGNVENLDITLTSLDPFAPMLHYIDEIKIYCENGYKSRFKKVKSSAVSVEDLFKYRVFPNPVYNELNIETGLMEATSHKLKIVSVEGKLILDTILKSNRNSIDISGIPKGIYFLELSSGLHFQKEILFIN